ncbi:MAG: twin-arginine translocation signal domain-containing protein [Betaproteobacteria bacterium]|nr:twin-arginine translocation signal domain-containing protein [Candidatus Dechloromonas phosphorivorans]
MQRRDFLKKASIGAGVGCGWAASQQWLHRAPVPVPAPASNGA